MKKTLSLIMALGIVLATAGCGGSTSSTAPSAADSTAASTAASQEPTKATSDFPKKPIQIICPVKAGGDTDRNTRTLAVAMQKQLGTTVVVVNVDGGATVMGMQQLLDSNPDGYTLVVNGTDMFVPYMMGISDITIDSFKTVGISSIDNSTVLAVNAKSGYKDLKDLVDKSIAAPESIEYGGKIGATNQICGVAMNTVWGSKFKFVDVGNNAAKMTALLAEQTQVVNISYSLAKDYFVGGEFTPLVLLGSEKNPLLADVPVAEDFGYKPVDFSKFFWVGAHPDTPDEIINILADALEKSTQDADFIKNMESNYLTPKFIGKQEAADYAMKFYEQTMLPYKEAFMSAQ